MYWGQRLVGRGFKLFVFCMTFWAGVLSAQSHFYAESNSASSETIKIAALSYLGADATRQEWQPTVNWLVNDLPQY